ncbi:hypothetical protein RIF29_40507 [Crotalaria pallida]|uniref:Uncharacterized protein n=1 Tax=Crotalaria pallida TaxID=3830 RepID=A0AAN9E3A9_CROPI
MMAPKNAKGKNVVRRILQREGPSEPVTPSSSSSEEPIEKDPIDAAMPDEETAEEQPQIPDPQDTSLLTTNTF